MAKKVVLAAQPMQPLVTQLLADQVEFRVAASSEPSVVAREMAGVHGLLVRLTKLTAEIIDAGDCLEVIGRTGVGVDNIDVAAATRRGVPVVYTPEANTLSVAEHVLALLLALVKRIHLVDPAVRQGNWAAREEYGRELTGLTFGFVGLGRIGYLTARKCRDAFDAQILTYDPYLKPEIVASLGATRVESLEELLRRSDVISLHVPLSAETSGLIGARELALMKPTAYLVNASRGSVVDEEALAEALKAGVLAGAALDVFSKEPLPASSPLCGLPNIVLTPHSAALTHEAMNRVLRTMVADVLAVMNGGRPRYAANPEVLTKF